MAPQNENARLTVLRDLHFLYANRDPMFQDITTLAARLLDAPIAFVSLVEEDYQFFRGCVGLEIARTSRDVSFCSHAIDRPDLTHPFVVPDASQDPRFMNNPLVTDGIKIRMYSGQPLVLDDGLPVGALCVIDGRPRMPTPLQLESLAVLARCVVSQIQARRDAEALRASEERNRQIVDGALDAVITLTESGRITEWNFSAETLFGLSDLENGNLHLSYLVSSLNEKGFAPDEVQQTLTAVAELGGRHHAQIMMRKARGGDFPAEISLMPIRAGGELLYSAFIRDQTDRVHHEALRRESESRDIAIFALARLAESRDPDTGAHVERVQQYCLALVNAMREAGAYADFIDDEFVRLLYSTCPLHDIGKVGIPDEVLLKPGKLTEAEMAVMRTHAELGSETLEAAVQRFPRARFLRIARNIAATHHEKFDGTGYPEGLEGQEIPLCGRIVALADVYDALTSRRVYKAAMPHEAARAIILKESGKHFDPVVVESFLAAEQSFRAIVGQHEVAVRAA